jgi:hypothetical protein
VAAACERAQRRARDAHGFSLGHRRPARDIASDLGTVKVSAQATGGNAALHVRCTRRRQASERSGARGTHMFVVWVIAFQPETSPLTLVKPRYLRRRRAGTQLST